MPGGPIRSKAPNTKILVTLFALDFESAKECWKTTKGQMKKATACVEDRAINQILDAKSKFTTSEKVEREPNQSTLRYADALKLSLAEDIYRYVFDNIANGNKVVYTDLNKHHLLAIKHVQKVCNIKEVEMSLELIADLALALRQIANREDMLDRLFHGAKDEQEWRPIRIGARASKMDGPGYHSSIFLRSPSLKLDITFGGYRNFRLKDSLYHSRMNDAILPYSDIELIALDSENQQDSHRSINKKHGTPIPDDILGTGELLLTDKTIWLNVATLRTILKATAKVYFSDSYYFLLRNCNSLRVSLWYIFTGEWNTRLVMEGPFKAVANFFKKERAYRPFREDMRDFFLRQQINRLTGNKPLDRKYTDDKEKQFLMLQIEIYHDFQIGKGDLDAPRLTKAPKGDLEKILLKLELRKWSDSKVNLINLPKQLDKMNLKKLRMVYAESVNHIISNLIAADDNPFDKDAVETHVSKLSSPEILLHYADEVKARKAELGLRVLKIEGRDNYEDVLSAELEGPVREFIDKAKAAEVTFLQKQGSATIG